MPSDFPRKPSGSDEEMRFHRTVYDKTFGPAGQIRNSSTVKVSRTSRGIILHASPPSPGGGKQFLYRITSLYNADYFGARKWNPLANNGNGDYIGAEENIAKCITGRMPDSELIDGFGTNYVYSDENLRSAATQYSTTEYDVMHPRYTAFDPDNPDDYGNLIIVARIPNGTGVTDDNNRQIYLMEIQPTRYWTYKNEQQLT
jgi:hypothetical protein